MRLATICARGGSKGVPGKNIRILGGKPLIAHTIEQAMAANVFDVIAVSSDSEEILRVAERWGVAHLVHRPAELASDSSAKIPVIRHCTVEIETQLSSVFRTITDLAVTSPLRTIEDIRGAIATLDSSGASNVVSVQVAPHSPYYGMIERDGDGRLVYCKSLAGEIHRRQDAPICYAMNGAVYVWSRQQLFSDTLKSVGPRTEIFVMPEERSIDIDREIDFKIAECLLGS
jgi:N-acylneuraminate cytidylyltransferase/CMP-N,N'-diacetyllegionaminic acid synthase